MSNVKIREATLSDVDAVIDLAVQSIPYSASPFRDTPQETVMQFRRLDLEQIRVLLGQSHFGLFVADDHGKVVGHVIVLSGIIESVSGEEQGWIIDLSVQPDYWRKGIARELSLKAEAFVKQKGLKYIGLGVTSANTRAIHFYEKLGYAEERKRMIKQI